MICADRPGFGLSDFQEGRKVVDWPGDLAQLLDHLGVDRFRGLAISAGSPYLLAACMAMPERMEMGMIVTGITPKDEAGILHTALPSPLHWAVRRSLRMSQLMHALLVLGMRRAPERAMPKLSRTLSPPDAKVLARPEAGSFVIATSLESARRGVRGWAYDDWLLNRPWEFSLRDVPPQTPIRLFWGDADLSVPLEHGKELAEQLPNASLRIFPGEGHFGVIFDHIEEVLDELTSPNGA